MEEDVPQETLPDPKAIRHSSRREALKAVHYNTKHHPQDNGLPGFQHKAKAARKTATRKVIRSGPLRQDREGRASSIAGETHGPKDNLEDGQPLPSSRLHKKPRVLSEVRVRQEKVRGRKKKVANQSAEEEAEDQPPILPEASQSADNMLEAFEDGPYGSQALNSGHDDGTVEITLASSHTASNSKTPTSSAHGRAMMIAADGLKLMDANNHASDTDEDPLDDLERVGTVPPSPEDMVRPDESATQKDETDNQIDLPNGVSSPATNESRPSSDGREKTDDYLETGALNNDDDDDDYGGELMVVNDNEQPLALCAPLDADGDMAKASQSGKIMSESHNPATSDDILARIADLETQTQTQQPNSRPGEVTKDGPPTRRIDHTSSSSSDKRAITETGTRVTPYRVAQSKETTHSERPQRGEAGHRTETRSATLITSKSGTTSRNVSRSSTQDISTIVETYADEQQPVSHCEGHLMMTENRDDEADEQERRSSGPS